jgi:hypothetical protein
MSGGDVFLTMKLWNPGEELSWLEALLRESSEDKPFSRGRWVPWKLPNLFGSAISGLSRVGETDPST